MDDHFEVCEYLRNLSTRQVMELGVALGITHPRLRRMKDHISEMVAAWLIQSDNVLRKSGIPCLSTLAKALEEIGERGIARDLMGFDDTDAVSVSDLPQRPLSSLSQGQKFSMYHVYM